MSASRTAPGLLAALLALLWLALGPSTPDLAAQVYRTGLFEREGWAIFDLSWYGGHHMPGYSLLFAPLGSLLGVRLAGAVAAVASAILFERIAHRRFGDGARWGALWFGAGSVADLLIGRLTFALGVAVALGAVLALQNGRRRIGLALGVATTLASPVAGLFLAMAGIAHGLATRKRTGLWLAVASFTPAAALALLFPEGGSQPFSAAELAAVVLCCALLLRALPARERALRAGALAYLGATLLAFVVASPMGSNATRLGVAFAGPLLLCAVARDGAQRQRRIALAAVIPLIAWQGWAPVRETLKGAGDPSARLAYFTPVLSFLEERAQAAPLRVEVPFTRLHYEAVYVARRMSLARGWETQLDVKYNGLFRASGASGLTAARYEGWLRREGVRYVALPGVALDPTGRAEAQLIRHGMPFLREVSATPTGRSSRCAGLPGSPTASDASRESPRNPSRCVSRGPGRRSCACVTRPTGASFTAAAASPARMAVGRWCERSGPGRSRCERASIRDDCWAPARAARTAPAPAPSVSCDVWSHRRRE